MANPRSEHVNTASEQTCPKAANSELDEKLLKAARDGESTIEILLNEGANIHVVSEEYGETPLHLASARGDEDAVKALLARGADINLQDRDGWTPLYTASSSGNASIVNLLLFLSSSSPLPNRELKTLTPSKSLGKRDIQPKLRQGIQIDLADNKQLTPLHAASYWGDADIVQAIVAFKSNLEPWNADRTLDRKDEMGRSALYIAVEEGFPDVVYELIGADTSLIVHNETALHLASRSGNAAIVWALLQLGADVMAKVSKAKDQVPLHIAALNGHVEIIEQLLKKSLEVSRQQMYARTSDGDTALHLAASKDHLKSVETLSKIMDQQTLDARNDLGKTALHVALEGGFTKVAMCLLSNAGVAIQTPNGDSALHLACGTGLTDVVQALLSAKNASSVIALRNKAGETALGRAIESQRWQISEMMLEFILLSRNKAVDLGQLNLEETLMCAAQQRLSHNVVRLLLMMTTHDERMKKCSDVQAGRNESSRGWTALHWAAYHGRWEVVYQLLHNAAWTEREMRTAYITGEGGRQELMGTGEENAREIRWEGSHTGSEDHARRQRDATRPPGMNGLREMKQSANQNEGDERDGQKRYRITLDMLKNPPLFEPPDSEKTYTMPKLSHGSDDVLNNYFATIVDFYSHGDRSDLLRRSRTVPDVVYSKGGPDEIMNEARNTLDKVDKDAAKKKNYSEGDLRFRWIHLPANNLDWMTDLAQRIYMDRHRLEQEFRDLEDFIWQSWYELPEGPSPRHYMRPGCKTETFAETLKDLSKNKRKRMFKHNNNSEQNRLSRVALYMPYITFAVHTPQNPKGSQRPEQPEEASNTNTGVQDYKPPTAQNLHPLDNLLFQSFSSDEAMKDTRRYESLLSLYEGKIIHRSRTLDESYYDFLVDMNERNEDQVATKYLGRFSDVDNTRDHVRFEKIFNIDNRAATSYDNKDSNAGYNRAQHDSMKILRVDQLWLWVIDDKTIITSSTHRQDHADDPVLEKIFAYIREENSKKTGRKPLPTTVIEMSFFIPKFCIGFLNYCNWKDEFDINQSISQIFANSINDQADRELRLFKDFTEKIASVVQAIEEEKNDKNGKPATIFGGRRKNSERFKRVEGTTADEERTFKSIGKAATQLIQIKDIRDELNMLKAIVNQQKKVWDELLSKAPKNAFSRNAAEYTIANIEEMDYVASRIQDAILAIMNLEQSEASILEAVSSRKQAQETIEQGRTLMVFTVITIIFLPLSFLASLFALNITDFPHTAGDPQSGSLQYKIGWLFPILFGVTAGIFILAVAIGFYRPLSRFGHSLWKNWISLSIDTFGRRRSPQEAAENLNSSLHKELKLPTYWTPQLSSSEYTHDNLTNESHRLLRSHGIELGERTRTGTDISFTRQYRKSGIASGQEYFASADEAKEHRSFVRRMSSSLIHRADGKSGTARKGIV